MEYVAPSPRCLVAKPMAVITGTRSNLTTRMPFSTASSNESPKRLGMARRSSMKAKWNLPRSRVAAMFW